MGHQLDGISVIANPCITQGLWTGTHAHVWLVIGARLDMGWLMREITRLSLYT